MGRKKKPKHYPPSVLRYRERNPQISFRIKLEKKKALEDIIGEDTTITPSQWCKARILELIEKAGKK